MNATDRILGEDAEAEKANLAYFRALSNGRSPMDEPVIAKDPEYAYRYALNVINGRWPEAEPYIATNAKWAYRYAKNVIRKRFPDGEPTIAKDPFSAFHYAYNIIGRFPEAEETLASSGGPYKGWYLEAFPEAKDEWIMNGWLGYLD